MSDLTLAEFLAARLDEKARDADDFHTRDCATAGPVPFPCDCGHPARVLREVEVWRRLLLEHRLKGVDAVYAGTERETGFHLALSLALKSKAAVYRDHPDYREDWDESAGDH